MVIKCENDWPAESPVCPRCKLTVAFSGPFDQQGVDTITDFVAGVETIWVDVNWHFPNDFISSAEFRSGAGVTTANTLTQRLIYNTSNGNLYLDIDGSGAATAVLFAVISNQAALTADDFGILLGEF